MGNLLLDLPPDDYFDLRDVPDMLARARRPDTQAPIMVCTLDKYAGDNRRPQRLDASDWQLLLTIWGSTPDFPMTEDAWRPYAEAFAKSADKPAWELVPLIDDPTLDLAMLRLITAAEYQDVVNRAIADGSLEVLSELTYAPIIPGAIISPNGGTVVARHTLLQFAARFGMEAAPVTRGRHAARERHARKTELTRARDAAKALFHDWATTHASPELRKLRTNGDFADECKRRWPVLNRDTLTRKWIPDWRNAEKAQAPAPADVAAWRNRVTSKDSPC